MGFLRASTVVGRRWLLGLLVQNQPLLRFAGLWIKLAGPEQVLVSDRFVLKPSCNIRPAEPRTDSCEAKSFELGGRRDKEGQNDNDDDRREHDDPQDNGAMDVGGGGGGGGEWRLNRMATQRRTL